MEAVHPPPIRYNSHCSPAHVSQLNICVYCLRLSMTPSLLLIHISLHTISHSLIPHYTQYRIHSFLITHSLLLIHYSLHTVSHSFIPHYTQYLTHPFLITPSLLPTDLSVLLMSQCRLVRVSFPINDHQCILSLHHGSIGSWYASMEHNVGTIDDNVMMITW